MIPPLSFATAISQSDSFLNTVLQFKITNDSPCSISAIYFNDISAPGFLCLQIEANPSETLPFDPGTSKTGHINEAKIDEFAALFQTCVRKCANGGRLPKTTNQQ